MKEGQNAASNTYSLSAQPLTMPAHHHHLAGSLLPCGIQHPTVLATHHHALQRPGCRLDLATLQASKPSHCKVLGS